MTRSPRSCPGNLVLQYPVNCFELFWVQGFGFLNVGYGSETLSCWGIWEVRIRTECVIDTVQAAAYLGQAVAFLYKAIDYDGLECPNNSPVGCAAQRCRLHHVHQLDRFVPVLCGKRLRPGCQQRCVVRW